jgi:hypothetical protein
VLSSGVLCRALVLFERQQATSTAPMSRASYADLFPPCKSGCGDVAETRDGHCDRCASDREWQAHRDARAR